MFRFLTLTFLLPVLCTCNVAHPLFNVVYSTSCRSVLVVVTVVVVVVVGGGGGGGQTG